LDSRKAAWSEDRSKQFHLAANAALDGVGILHNGGDLQVIRADIVTERETINWALAGDDVDLPAAAAMLDRALQGLCPHDPRERYTAPDSADRMLTTCPACGVSWFELTGEGSR
jgi:hypothetical protein